MASEKRSSPLDLKKLLLLVVVVGLAYGYQQIFGDAEAGGGGPATTTEERSGAATATGDGAEVIARADREGTSDFMVEATGTVERVLSDDTEVPRHQRFILRLGNGHTVLVAHNIDLAKRLPLAEGDSVTFFGEYESNDRGGVIHWTHHDPAGRHEGGWLRHRGVVYE